MNKILVKQNATQRPTFLLNESSRTNLVFETKQNLKNKLQNLFTTLIQLRVCIFI